MVLEQILDLGQINQAKFDARLHVDEHIDVAVSACCIAYHRAENGK